MPDGFLNLETISNLFHGCQEVWVATQKSNSKSSLILNPTHQLSVSRNTPFLYKQFIFDPRPENCLSFSEKLPRKIV